MKSSRQMRSPRSTIQACRDTDHNSLQVFDEYSEPLYFYHPVRHPKSSRATRCSTEGVQRRGDLSAFGPRAHALAEFNANNALWLRKLRDEGTVKILKFDDSTLKAFLAISKDVVAEISPGRVKR